MSINTHSIVSRVGAEKTIIGDQSAAHIYMKGVLCDKYY